VPCVRPGAFDQPKDRQGGPADNDAGHGLICILLLRKPLRRLKPEYGGPCLAAIDAPAVALSALMGLDLRQSIRESDDLLFITSVARSVGIRRRAMPTKTLCPKCHGQRTTYCRVCRGTGKKSVAGISVGNCNTCGGSGRRRCDVCGGSGEVEPPNEKTAASTDHRAP
jgi:hypothetical protein